ncbi:hypothetical protein AYI69_g3702 [Smittium culicis]|uniref:Uncharacterized protein n=1 Tax=Smittium culicis TaxID=133412 RepID=A0A1R1YJ28_9FUNG|nr:hypothetical protein AYI69_g3702 [Smittium culicis]
MESIHIETIDGTPLTNTPINQIYKNISIVFDNIYNDHVSLYPIHSPNNPIVLGLPWLRKNNPKIDWIKNIFEFKTRVSSNIDHINTTEINAVFGAPYGGESDQDSTTIESESESDNPDTDQFFDTSTHESKKATTKDST